MAINKINYTTNKEGFVGLGPQRPGDDKSYVYTLFQQGQIADMKVGLNYEDNMNSSLVS